MDWCGHIYRNRWKKSGKKTQLTSRITLKHIESSEK
jgi:hypothetical protein